MDCIIIDTNIVRRGKDAFSFTELLEYLTSIEGSKSRVVFPEVVLDELSAYYKRKFLTEEFKSDKSLVLKEVLTLSEIETVHSKAMNYISGKLNEICRNEIICINRNMAIDEVYDRALRKIPPFVDSSDKGFKDTLIWISVLNYDSTNYENVFFLTKDGGFIKNRNFLEEEYKNRTGKEIKIIEKFDRNTIEDSKNKIESKVVSETSKKIENPKTDNFNELAEIYSTISNLRDKLHKKLESLLFYEVHEWSGDSWMNVRFKMLDEIDTGIIRQLIDASNNLLERHMLAESISPAELFALTYEVNAEIPVQIYIDFIDCLIEIESVYPDYLNALELIVIDTINKKCYYPKDYSEKFEKDSDDLPF